MQKERDITIDIAKGIGIALVVACHANFAPVSPGRFFHMPLFFFLTGYLSLYSDRFLPFVQRKIRTLYIPFIVTELVFLLTNPLWIMMGISTPSQYSLTEQLLHIGCFDNISLILSPIWFLPALFVVNLVGYGLVQWQKKSKVKCIPLVCSILLCALGIANTHLGWMRIPCSFNFKEAINVILVAQMFCFVGYLTKQYHISINKGWLVVLAFVYLYVAKLWLNLGVDMRSNHYSSTPLFISAALGGIYLTIYISQRISSWSHAIGQLLTRLLSIMGKASLYIMLLHIFCFKIVGYVQAVITHTSIDNSHWENPGCIGLWCIVYIIAGIVIPLCIYSLIQQVKHARH